jgi:hypothetical protein
VLTLFSIPKPFQGHFKTIQTNAIRSWAQLRPRPEIILLGDDEGTAEMAKEVGAIHIPQVERTDSGTPLVNSLFAKAENASSNDLMCLVLADIILMSDFAQAVQNMSRLTSGKPSLLIGRKSIVDIPDSLDFTQADWESRLKQRVADAGRYGTSDTDYWLYGRGLWTDIPPFAIGRYYWSAWLTYAAHRRGSMVVDATSVITAVESTHDYSHITSVGGRILMSPDVVSNAKLFRGARFWTTANAPYTLTASGLERSQFSHRLLGVFLGLDHQLGLDFHVYRSIYYRAVHGVYRLLRPVILGLKHHILQRALAAK